MCTIFTTKLLPSFCTWSTSFTTPSVSPVHHQNSLETLTKTSFFFWFQNCFPSTATIPKDRANLLRETSHPLVRVVSVDPLGSHGSGSKNGLELKLALFGAEMGLVQKDVAHTHLSWSSSITLRKRVWSSPIWPSPPTLGCRICFLDSPCAKCKLLNQIFFLYQRLKRANMQHVRSALIAQLVVCVFCKHWDNL
jgi:hypothetical protein